MPLLATLAAITGCIILGLILTAIGWLLSRWLGKSAAARELGGEGVASGDDRHFEEMALTHFEGASNR